MDTLLDKIWQAHVVDQADGASLLYVDRHYTHEVTSPQAYAGLRQAGRKVRRPDLTFAVMDHVVPTDQQRRRPLADAEAEAQLQALQDNCAQFEVSLLDMEHPYMGIVHVALPELGLTLPGLTVFCGDSHTATHGAFGALAFGIGTSEVEQVLATQCLPQVKPKTLAVWLEGAPGPGVTAKDIILAVITQLGAGGGTGHIIEYRGQMLATLGMDERMTICNMSVECGAKAGLMAPDEVTFAYLEGRPFAPLGDDFAKAVQYWRTLASDPGAVYDRELRVDLGAIEPQVTWGTNPAQAAGVGDTVPDPQDLAQPEQAKAARKALDYMDLKPGTPLNEIPVDCVFIGSCTNGRLVDLRQAAQVARGHRVASGVRALVVPGSNQVRLQAEAEGLDEVFLDAGFEWRRPGCSMCLAMNPDVVAPGQRCVSTSNRNFQDRQGRGARTHLASPATAAASAISGRISDPRRMG